MKATLILTGLLCAVAPLCFGAGVLHQADLEAGRAPEVGDTVLLDDFARCFPHSAVSKSSEKGKWWLRPYHTDTAAGSMLCVEERDPEHPQTCIAPELTLPVNLEGTCDIWVGAYRPALRGDGVDIRLTRDKVFTTIDSTEDGVTKWPPKAEKTGRIVEVFYKTADLAGQDFHIRQPFGTYDSLWWGLCNSHLAYIKLVRRAPDDVAREAAARARQERKGVIVDRDGFSWVWQYGVEDIQCILQQVEQFQYGNVEALNWCIGGSLGTNFPHPMTTGRITGGARKGDKRAEHVYQWFEERKIDTLQAMVDRCHELGIKIYASHRANVHYYKNNVWDEHPEWILKSRKGLDYANPEARNFYRDFVLYIPENYDVDGLTIDFSRHRQHFNPGQENQFELMNGYLRELRAGLDRIGKARGKHLVLNASFTCGTWYDTNLPAAQGLDVQTWVDEGIVDCIMPEGKDVMKYIEMCKDKPVRCYPRKTCCLKFDGSRLQEDTHDPTAAQDAEDEPPLAQLTPTQIEAGVLHWYEAGADGVFLFNYQSINTLRNLPYPALVKQEVASGQPFGRVVGEKVEWVKGEG